MFKNYLKIIIRNIKKHKVYSIINITGLGIAFLCSLLILLYVKEELSYERCFSKADRIYRLTSRAKSGDIYRHWAKGPPPLGPMLQEQIPEIEQAARFRTIKPVVLSYTPGHGVVRRFKEDGGFFADPAVIDLFDIKFIKGDARKALSEVNSVILTASLAEKYFGKDDPIGKSLVEENSNRAYRVTGVIEDMPANTHLQFDYLASMSTWYQIMNNHPLLNSRTWKALYIYVLLNPQNERGLVESKLADFIQQSFQSRFEQTLHLQPIKDIHLHSKLESEMGPNSDIVYVYVFSCTALLTLVIAIVNFVNLSSAQALMRMKEVGVRKVLGAQKRQLVMQFLGESLVLTCIAGIVALLLLDFLVPLYNSIAGKSFSFEQLASMENMLLMLFIVVGTGLTAGLYPAFFVSSFRPVNTLKGQKAPQSSVPLVRKGLVVFQFAISIFMIFSTITIYKQLMFFRNKYLGFDKEKLIAVELYGEDTVTQMETIKNELRNHAAISHLSLVSNLPGERFSAEHLIPEGGPGVEDMPLVRIIHVDEDFLKTLDIELKEGEDFQKRSSELGQFLLSETAVQTLGLKDPIGKRADNYGWKGEIVGVFRDFHFASLHDVIEPLVLDYRPGETKYLLVKFQGSNISEVLKTVEQKLHEVAPHHLFIYTFVDDNLNRLYAFEDKVGDIFEMFSLVAIFISCLGLLGLSIYSAELKVKEIGMRKVLGASVFGITTLLSKDFVKWVLLANLLAWPVAWFVMNRWLENFAYRIEISWWVFALAGGVALAIALLTVSTQAIRAALANPVESLRYE